MGKKMNWIKMDQMPAEDMNREFCRKEFRVLNPEIQLSMCWRSLIKGWNR